MSKVKNPFIVTGKIDAEYFCDRVTESARVIKTITNENNLVIISPRRMGKDRNRHILISYHIRLDEDRLRCSEDGSRRVIKVS